jgi:succinate dehydrogenase / fumarate reductase iron-sulfur subunit
MHPKQEPTDHKTFSFEVFRYDAARNEPPRFETYELEVSSQTSVLEGLLRIQDEQDPSLAFRYSCRGAVCGSCGMSINGRLNLACRVQLHLLAGRRVVLEPLPGLEIIKDLVVDMDPFWQKYERVQPWLHAEITAAEGVGMSERERQRIDQYVNCILCGMCYAACPVTKSNERFTGPAALAKLYRFLADSRENRDGVTLEQENSEAGMWGCHTIMKCCEVCPKEVRPTDGIRGVRRKHLSHKFKQVIRRDPRET